MKGQADAIGSAWKGSKVSVFGKYTSWILYSSALIVLVLVFWLFGKPPLGPEVDQRAPAFSLETLDGKLVTSADLRGKPLFINFWATWCIPCRQEMPHIESLYKEFEGDFNVVAVSDENPALVSDYIKKYGYTFPVYIDPESAMNKAYLIKFIPTSVFVDADGVIRSRHVGQMNRSEMKTALEQIVR